MEEWKDIYYFDYTKDEWIDYRGLYQVSNKGNVKSLNYRQTNKDKYLSMFKINTVYIRVTLCKNGVLKKFLVHRLVAFMFIENNEPLLKTQINHIDENKTNNCVENLEWCTNEYNNNYGNCLKRNKYLSKKVICITTGEIFESTIEAEIKTGISHGNISSCCNKKLKSAEKDENGNKLVWKYLEED